jgi:predicted dehydrogenase
MGKQFRCSSSVGGNGLAVKTGEVRVGVVGVGRGVSLARGTQYAGMKLVALCDKQEKKLAEAGKQIGVKTYTDYGEFLEQDDMDAVILANYFHEHAPFAVKALEAGKHVMSETAACHTLAEGVALVRAVEKTGKIYMFAENYPYMRHNQEMRRLYEEGVVGEFKYGEGEYIHPMSARAYNILSPGMNHWRNWIPATYYCTHAIAPVMYVTGTRPVRVNGFLVPHDFNDQEMNLTVRRGDTAGLIICQMDNGALMKALQYHLRGHGVFVRIHGNRGLVDGKSSRW